MIHCEQPAVGEHQVTTPNHYKQHQVHQLTTLSSASASSSSSPSSLSTSSSSSTPTSASCPLSPSLATLASTTARVREHNISASEARFYEQTIDLLIDCQPNELITEHDQHHHHANQQQQQAPTVNKELNHQFYCDSFQAKISTIPQCSSSPSTTSSSASNYHRSSPQELHHKHNEHERHHYPHRQQLASDQEQKSKDSKRLSCLEGQDTMRISHIDSLVGAQASLIGDSHSNKQLDMLDEGHREHTHSYQDETSHVHHLQQHHQRQDQNQTSRELYNGGCQQEQEQQRERQQCQQDWTGQNHHHPHPHHPHHHHHHQLDQRQKHHPGLQQQRILIEDEHRSGVSDQIEFTLDSSYKQDPNSQHHCAQLDSIDESANARFNTDINRPQSSSAANSPKSTDAAIKVPVMSMPAASGQQHHYLTGDTKSNNGNQSSLSDYNNNSQQQQQQQRHLDQDSLSHGQTTYAALMPSLAGMTPDQRQTTSNQEDQFDFFQCDQNLHHFSDETSIKIEANGENNNNISGNNNRNNADNYDHHNHNHNEHNQNHHQLRGYHQSGGSMVQDATEYSGVKQEVIQSSSPNELIVSSSSASSSLSSSSLSSLSPSSSPSLHLGGSYLANTGSERHLTHQRSPLISTTLTDELQSSTRATSRQNPVPNLQYQFYSSAPSQQQHLQQPHEHQQSQNLFNLSSNYVDIRPISNGGHQQQQQQQSFQDSYYNSNSNNHNHSSHCDQQQAQQQQQLCNDSIEPNSYYELDVHKDHHLVKPQDDQQCQYMGGSNQLSSQTGGYLDRAPESLNHHQQQHHHHHHLQQAAPPQPHSHLSSQYQPTYDYGDNRQQDHGHHLDHLQQHQQPQLAAPSLPSYVVPSNMDTDGYYSNHVTASMSSTTTTTATSTPALDACNKNDSPMPVTSGASLSSNYDGTGTGRNLSGNLVGPKVGPPTTLAKETTIVLSSRPRGSRGRPRKKKGNAKGKVSGKLWEFIRDLLLNECTNPSFIRWERREDGVFKFVQSDKVAKMWGERKQNPKMTYEKLSRAMRYYYKSKVLLPVFGRRLVYKFGPNATGWMSAQQQLEHEQLNQNRQASHQLQQQPPNHHHHHHHHQPGRQQTAMSSTVAQMTDAIETSHHEEAPIEQHGTGYY